MSSYSELELTTGNGRLRGFGNVLQMENRKWWDGRRLLVRAGLWLLLLNGLLAATLFILPNLTDPEGEPLLPEDPLQMGSELFVGIFMLALAIGIVILMQDAIIEEKQTGTAAWVLSKPVSRDAFILAKLAANVAGMVCLMILLPAVVAYGMFWLYEPGTIALPNFAKMTAVVGLHSLFYLTLTLLMGVLTNSRGVLLVVTLGVLLGGGLVPIQALVQISPWQLPQIGLLLLQGQPIGSMGMTMIVATTVWSLVFLIAAVWQFERTEF